MSVLLSRVAAESEDQNSVAAAETEYTEVQPRQADPTRGENDAQLFQTETSPLPLKEITMCLFCFSSGDEGHRHGLQRSERLQARYDQHP